MSERLPDAQGPHPIAYAFHFDASLYAGFLRGIAEQQGTRRREGRIVKVHRDGESGDVASVELEVAGRNLHTWTDYSGYAPDSHYGGSGSGSAGSESNGGVLPFRCHATRTCRSACSCSMPPARPWTSMAASRPWSRRRSGHPRRGSARPSCRSPQARRPSSSRVSRPPTPAPAPASGDPTARRGTRGERAHHVDLPVIRPAHPRGQRPSGRHQRATRRRRPASA